MSRKNLKSYPIIKMVPSKEDIDAIIMDNCFIDTAAYDATMALARNTGAEQDIETIFEKLAKLTVVPIASGKSREPVVFILDSLGALEGL